MGPDADCLLRTGTCGCRVGYGLWDNKCYIPALLNSTCKVTQECFLGSNTNAVCLPGPFEKTCQCSQGSDYVPSFSSCLRRRLIGDDCVSQDECEYSIKGIVLCSNGLCRCGLGEVGSVNRTTCSGQNSLRRNLAVDLMFFTTILSFITNL